MLHVLYKGGVGSSLSRPGFTGLTTLVVPVPGSREALLNYTNITPSFDLCTTFLPSDLSFQGFGPGQSSATGIRVVLSRTPRLVFDSSHPDLAGGAPTLKSKD